MILKKINEYSNENFKSFDCNIVELNLYLKCFALKNDISGYSKSYILEDNKEIIGYFTLCSAQIEYKDLPLNNKMPRYPVPAIRIARLAIRNESQKWDMEMN